MFSRNNHKGFSVHICMDREFLLFGTKCQLRQWFDSSLFKRHLRNSHIFYTLQIGKCQSCFLIKVHWNLKIDYGGLEVFLVSLPGNLHPTVNLAYCKHNRRKLWIPDGLSKMKTGYQAFFLAFWEGSVFVLSSKMTHSRGRERWWIGLWLTLLVELNEIIVHIWLQMMHLPLWCSDGTIHFKTKCSQEPKSQISVFNIPLHVTNLTRMRRSYPPTFVTDHMEARLIHNVTADTALPVQQGETVATNFCTFCVYSRMEGKKSQTNRTGYSGVRRRPWGRSSAEIRDCQQEQGHWLGTFDTDEKAARFYVSAAGRLKGPKAKDQFPRRKRSPSKLFTASSRRTWRSLRRWVDQLGRDNQWYREFQDMAIHHYDSCIDWDE